MKTNTELKQLQHRYSLNNVAVANLLGVSVDLVKKWRLSSSHSDYRPMKPRYLIMLKLIVYVCRNTPIESLIKNKPPVSLEPLRKSDLLPKYLK